MTDDPERRLGVELFNAAWELMTKPEPSLHHAQRVLDVCTENGIGEWDPAFAHEALARAHALACDTGAARHHMDEARAVEIADDEDRRLLLADLETISIPS